MHANPCPTRYPGILCLKFANTTCCLGYRNLFNGPMKHVSMDKAIALAEKNDPQRSQMLSSVESYEAVFDSSAGKQINSDDGRIVKPQFLIQEDEDNTTFKTLGPVWWPASALAVMDVKHEESAVVPLLGDVKTASGAWA